MTTRPAPATLGIAGAAAYVGLSVNTFRAEVAAGTMPPPVPLACRRKLWSRAALDRAIEGPDAASEPPAPLGEQIADAIDAYAP